ncbi:MAG: hypothetical protein A3E88_00825 [Legionellales bacterium RIFCSPHIGHO2_12_FULL_35_11]|nr:MAG: hypothetical protein A3E88_00825 [Legionellales bacterium RIFCSPHIGHO2_12_FULL_35_11]
MFNRKKATNNLATFDLRRYKYWQAIFLSFYSRKLYIDVAKRWRGIGLTYCLTLLIFACIPLGIKYMLNFEQYIWKDLIEPMSKIPEIIVENGEVIFKQNKPYFIKNQKGNDVIIIDTTDQIKEITDEYPDLFMLIRKKQYFFRDPRVEFLKDNERNQEFYNKREIFTYSYEGFKNEKFIGKEWVKEVGLNKVKNAILIFVYPLLVSCIYGVLITIMIVFAMMGQVASITIFKHKLKFTQACRVMFVSSTFGTVIFLMLRTLGFHSMKINFMCMIFIFIYFSYAILCIRKDGRQLVHY